MNLIRIHDLNHAELDIFTKLSETACLRYYEPDRGLFIAESSKVILRALDAGYEPLCALVQENHIDGDTSSVLSRLPDIPVYLAEETAFRTLRGFAMTRGMLVAMRRKELPDAAVLCRDARRIAVLENVVNPTNIGAIVRSAAALQIDCILFTGGCCDPLYRRAVRVSMGTIFQIPWTILDKSLNWEQHGIDLLHSYGFKTVAMALRDDSCSIDAPALRQEERLAILLGTEGDGLANSTIKNCDYTVRIPMKEGVDSLNVAAAGAIAFWELGRK